MAKINELTVELLEKSAVMLKALAHPQRIAIINLLQENERLTVNQIRDYLGISQAGTSHHLGILRDKGFLTSHRQGQQIFYKLKNDKLSQIVNCITSCASGE